MFCFSGKKTMARKINYIIACIFVLFQLIHATPIKFIEDHDDDDATNEGDMIQDMFKGIQNMLSNLEHSGRQEHNVTAHKPVFESHSFFPFPGPLKMHELVGKMFGSAENATAENSSHEMGNAASNEESDTIVKRSEIGCSDKEDCNKTSYCNKLSYTCETCHKDGGKCSHTEECCSGYKCDSEGNTCKKHKATFGGRCASKEDCSDDYCCALNNNGDGVCQPYLVLGEECGSDPFTSFFVSQSTFKKDAASGLPNKCPCHPGLKCKMQQSLLFGESEVCSRNERKSDGKGKGKAFIKIVFKTSPIMRFHSEGDIGGIQGHSMSSRLSMSSKDNEGALSPFSKELKLFGKPTHDSHRHGYPLRYSTRQKKPRNVSLRRTPFPFFPFPFMDLFDDQMDMDVKTDESRKRELKHDLKRERRRIVEEIRNEARESVHKAVDGIFDNIMKKVLE